MKIFIYNDKEGDKEIKQGRIRTHRNLNEYFLHNANFTMKQKTPEFQNMGWNYGLKFQTWWKKNMNLHDYAHGNKYKHVSRHNQGKVSSITDNRDFESPESWIQSAFKGKSIFPTDSPKLQKSKIISNLKL